MAKETRPFYQDRDTTTIAADFEVITKFVEVITKILFLRIGYQPTD